MGDHPSERADIADLLRAEVASMNRRVVSGPAGAAASMAVDQGSGDGTFTLE